MAKVKCIECFPLRADKIEEPGPEIDFCENRAPKICTPPLFPRLLRAERREPEILYAASIPEENTGAKQDP